MHIYDHAKDFWFFEFNIFPKGVKKWQSKVLQDLVFREKLLLI